MSNNFQKLVKAIGRSAAAQVRKSAEKGRCIAPGCNRKQYRDSLDCGRLKCAEWAMVHGLDDADAESLGL